MTCIVGLIDKGLVWIAGDSAGSDSRLFLTARRDPKVFRRGPFLIGFTDSFRMGQVLAHSLNVVLPFGAEVDEFDVFGFMVTTFVDAVRDCLKKAGFATKTNEQEGGGTFLVAFRGRLFQVFGDYQVSESQCGYMACGCGDLIAMGALHATIGKPADKRINAALEAAVSHSAGVLGPFTVLHT